MIYRRKKVILDKIRLIIDTRAKFEFDKGRHYIYLSNRIIPLKEAMIKNNNNIFKGSRYRYLKIIYI